jgi:hypothetical protein
MNVVYFMQKGNIGNPSGWHCPEKRIYNPRPCIPSGMQPVHLNTINIIQYV